MPGSKEKEQLTRTSGSSDRRDLFTRVSNWTIRITGGKWAFLVAFGTVIVWAVTGPIFQYSENWQLVINTGTTIVTFLMVFLIQGAQNRESKAIHLKLDELIVGVNRARNELVDIERLTDDQLDALAERYHNIGAKNQYKLKECFPGKPGDEPSPRENRKDHIAVK